MGRAPCCDKANVKKGPWSPEEDAKLKAYIEEHGTGGNWIALPQKIGLKRCGKSCRLRWLNYLRPNIKHGGFTEEEDNIICSLYISIGSRWSIIAAQLPGRTDNDIKNYWNTRLKKKLLGRRKQANRLSSISGQDPNKDHVNGSENSSYNLQNLSSSALERLQLHMQLQTLQNPLISFYNNPALWPKLSPLQQKMIQTLDSMNENRNILMQQNPLIHSQGAITNVPDLERGYSALNNLKADDLVNSINGFSSSESSFGLNGGGHVLSSDAVMGQNAGIQAGSGFMEAELDDILMNNKSSLGLVPIDAEFEYLKEMEGSRENLAWWSNEFEANSASSNSWDSTTMIHHQSQEIYGDYGIGSYNMQRQS